jgi:hypothetical protein
LHGARISRQTLHNPDPEQRLGTCRDYSHRSARWFRRRLDYLSGALAREREARYQQRKAEAYIELLAYMNAPYEAVSVLVPGTTKEARDRIQRGIHPELAPPDPPDPSATGRVAALLAAYASERVRDELYPKWESALSMFEGFADRFSRDPPVDWELIGAEYRRGCRQTEQDVAAQIRSELAPTAEE